MLGLISSYPGRNNQVKKGKRKKTNNIKFVNFLFIPCSVSLVLQDFK